MAKVTGLDAEGDVTLPMPPGGDAKARNYYGRILNMRETMKAPGERGVWFEVEGKKVKLAVTDPMPEPTTEPKAKLRVDNAEALRSAIDRARFRHRDAPPVAGTRGFYGTDPFGSRLEFRERK